MTLPRLSLVLALAGATLVLAGVLMGPASVDRLEGAWFTRAAGDAAISRSFRVSGSGLSLLGPGDGNLWLGAGIALLVAAAGGLFAHRAGVRLVRTRG